VSLEQFEGGQPVDEDPLDARVPAEQRCEVVDFQRRPVDLGVQAADPAASVDDQTPHTEDEVYYVLNGRATLVVEDRRTDVGPGSVAFVGAGDEHRFVDITQDLEVLVFWSPARHSNSSRVAR